ncbi:MAG: MltA domain-containing protein [Elusimicrobiales bacterium]|nr:MltA domain-containing protein [Elusimicrobiales bacterium]
MRAIIIFVLFLFSCHYRVKELKETNLNIDKNISSCPSESSQPLQIPQCGKDEILVCKKIEPKEAEIIKVEFPNILEFPLDESFKRAIDLNINYLKNLNKDVNYVFAGRKIDKNLLLSSSMKLKEIAETSKNYQDFKKLIIENFDFYELVKGTDMPTFSSYYEPIFEASFKKDNTYKYPIYRKPDDMIEVNLEDFDIDKYKAQKLTGRLVGTKMIPYYTRAEIDFDGILKDKGYEIAYLKDITDVLDLHTQGSGILKMKEGGYKRAKFAATNSLKFKGWMTVLLEKGYIERKGAIGEDKTFYDRAKEFINRNPHLWRDIIGSNKRYAFFYLDDLKSFDEGPIGTYGSNLVAQRSIAIDNSIIPLGAISFINIDLPVLDENLNIKEFKKAQRFTFCHDTGGAIKGARIDFFAGTGEKAKKFAYSLWKKGNLYLLVLKENKR